MRHAYYFVVVDQYMTMDPSVFCSQVFFSRKEMKEYLNHYISTYYSGSRLVDTEIHDSGITQISTYERTSGNITKIFVSEQ